MYSFISYWKVNIFVNRVQKNRAMFKKEQIVGYSKSPIHMLHLIKNSSFSLKKEKKKQTCLLL